MINPDWQAFLGAAGARIDNAQVADFGDLEGELAAARDATVLVPLTHLGLIACSGEDARDFLQNQLTSDVRQVGDGGAQHTAWCTAKGRMLMSGLLLRAGPDYQLRIAAELIPAMAKRLRMYVLRAKVKIEVPAENGAGRVLLGVNGPQAVAALAAAGLPQPAADFSLAACAVGQVLCLAPERFELAIEAAAAPAVWTALAKHARPVGHLVWRWLDIRSGWPLVTAATSEAFVPQMADFDRIGGVSFKKGCYPGQEIVARTHYLGKVKRHLYRVHSPTPLAAGDALWSAHSPEQAAGMVVDATPTADGDWAALAVVQESLAEEGTLRHLALDGSSVRIAAVAPPEAN